MTDRPPAADYAPLPPGALLAITDRLDAIIARLDAFAAGLAGMADDLKAASSGGLLGLLTGGRK